MNTETTTGFAQRALNHIIEPWSSWENFAFAITAGVRTFTDFTSEFGWPHLLSTLVLTGMFFLLGRKNGTVGSRSFFEFVCPREIYRHPSAILDYKFATISASTDLLIHAPVITGISLLVYKMTVYLFSGPWSLKEPFTNHPVATAIALLSQLMILSDLVYFISHYLMHKIPRYGHFIKYIIPPKYSHPSAWRESTQWNACFKPSFAHCWAGLGQAYIRRPLTFRYQSAPCLVSTRHCFSFFRLPITFDILISGFPMVLFSVGSL